MDVRTRPSPIWRLILAIGATTLLLLLLWRLGGTASGADQTDGETATETDSETDDGVDPTPLGTPLPPSPSAPTDETDDTGEIDEPTPSTDDMPIDRSNWEVTAVPSTDEEAGNAIDGNPVTRWTTGEVQGPGMVFEVDLGGDESFTWLTLEVDERSPYDYPRSYEVFAGDDPDSFGEPIASGEGAQTTEIDLPDSTAGYLRIVLTGTDDERWWSISELNLYRTDGEQADRPTVEPEQLPPGIDRGGWTVSASDEDEPATNAVDGDPESRWTTGVSQAPEQFVEIDLGEPTTFDRIRLETDSSAADFPREYLVFASDDPADYGSSIAAGEGAAITDISIPTTTARYVKIVQTGSDDKRWWSISELNLYGP